MGLVKVESSEGITTITMTRAEKRNALNQQLCDELLDAYTAFEAGPDQVAVLQADGPAFCVGADLKEPPAAMWKAVPHVSHKLSKPVIAATQGWVIGGAICMVMTCDLMVSADTTKFMYPDANVGVFGGLMPGIVSRIPHKVAMELLLLGEEISVKRAYDVGFVNKVVPLGEERLGEPVHHQFGSSVAPRRHTRPEGRKLGDSQSSRGHRSHGTLRTPRRGN